MNTTATPKTPGQLLFESMDIGEIPSSEILSRYETRAAKFLDAIAANAPQPPAPAPSGKSLGEIFKSAYSNHRGGDTSSYEAGAQAVKAHVLASLWRDPVTDPPTEADAEVLMIHDDRTMGVFPYDELKYCIGWMSIPTFTPFVKPEPTEEEIIAQLAKSTWESSSPQDAIAAAFAAGKEFQKKGTQP